jgi:hypothetical protein
MEVAGNHSRMSASLLCRYRIAFRSHKCTFIADCADAGRRMSFTLIPDCAGRRSLQGSGDSRHAHKHATVANKMAMGFSWPRPASGHSVPSAMQESSDDSTKSVMHAEPIMHAKGQCNERYVDRCSI